MKYYLPILCSWLLLGCSRQMTTASAQDLSLLQQHWIHSYEEDSRQNDTLAYKTYRPAGYRFPPARGRDAFELKTGGVYIAHPIAAGDGNTTLTQKWAVEKDRLVVTGDTGVLNFIIRSLTKDKLVLEEIPPQ